MVDDAPQMEMPKYRCHKVVHALKIAAIVVRSHTVNGVEQDGSAIITPVEKGYAPFKVDREFVVKHGPEPGGYYVVYADGYKSFSPAKAFEEGYTRIP